MAGVEIVGLSGTSSGAVCALLAWSALLDGEPAAAGGRLEAFWVDNSATTPLEQVVNAWVVWAAKLENLVVLPAVSPYDTPTSVHALQEFRTMLERQVDFDRLAAKAGGRRRLGADAGARGCRRSFRELPGVQQPSGADHRRDDLGLGGHSEPIRAVQVGGGTYWDGLFSQNPPVRELVDARPDELWVIQINPARRDREPRSSARSATVKEAESGVDGLQHRVAGGPDRLLLPTQHR